MEIAVSKNKKINIQFSKKSLLKVFKEISRFLLPIVFLGCVLFAVSFWYSYIYSFDWTEEQKQVYRSEYAGETTFREEKFDAIIDLLKKKDNLHQTLPETPRDPFFQKSL